MLCVCLSVRPSVCTSVYFYASLTVCMLLVCVSPESSGVSALQENLRKVQRELERAQTAEAHAKTGKKRMEAQLKRS